MYCQIIFGVFMFNLLIILFQIMHDRAEFSQTLKYVFPIIIFGLSNCQYFFKLLNDNI
jgi:hypothetical protein